MAQKINQNLAPPISEWLTGYISGGGSRVVDDTNGERTSPFIPITAGKTYKFSYTLENMPANKQYWSCIVYYVSENEQGMLGGRTTNGTQAVYYDLQKEAPTGTKYVRMSMRTYGCTTYPILVEL